MEIHTGIENECIVYLDNRANVDKPKTKRRKVFKEEKSLKSLNLLYRLGSPRQLKELGNNIDPAGSIPKVYSFRVFRKHNFYTKSYPRPKMIFMLGQIQSNGDYDHNIQLLKCFKHLNLLKKLEILFPGNHLNASFHSSFNF
jgi:hypothetical protein